MKKLVYSFSLLCSMMSYSQSNFSGFRLGLTAGANYSGVSNAHRPSGPRYSFQAGAFALVPLSKENQFYLQPEVLYHGAGETGKDSDFKNGNRDVNGYNALYANNYLSVPVYFKMYFSGKPNSFFAMAGPRFNFLINQDVKNVPLDRPYYDPNYSGKIAYSGKATNMNFAIGLGMGYSINREFEIVVKHDIGLTNTYKGLMNELSSRNKSEQVLSLGVNYIFR